MFKQIRLVLGALAVIILFASCSSGSSETAKPSASPSGEVTMNTAYMTISPADAKDLIRKENITLVDVRTPEEYQEGHIPQAVLLPLDDIELKAKDILPNKNAVIIVYCRSGRRSKIASDELSNMGYKTVYDLGGIIDWPYETVSG